MIEFLQTHWPEIIGSMLGLLYLYFEYKANIWMWPVGILMSIFYIYIFWHSGFYAGAAINLYYVFLGLYGLLAWNKVKKQHIKLRYMKPSQYWIIIATSAVLWVILAKILAQTDSSVYLADALITSLSVVAMWMLAQRYIEQWFLLIIANCLSIFVYLYAQLYPTTTMYTIYTFVSIAAYFHWKKLVLTQ